MSNEFQDPPAPNYIYLEERFDAGSSPGVVTPSKIGSEVPPIGLILLRLVGVYWIFESFPALSMLPQFLPSLMMGPNYGRYPSSFGPSFFYMGLGFLGVFIKFILAITFLVWTYRIAAWLGRPYLLSGSPSRSNH